MSGRNKTLVIYGIFYVLVAGVIFFGLRYHYQKNFANDKLQATISGKSVFRDMTTDLCRYQIIGDPKEPGNYVKISFLCSDGKKANSTLSLSAIDDKTVGGVIKEYARIIGFDEKLIKTENFVCYVDGHKLTDGMLSQTIRPTASLDCVENPKL